MDLHRGGTADRREVDVAAHPAALDDAGGTGRHVDRSLWRGQARHDGFGDVGDVFRRRRRPGPERDKSVEGFGAGIESDDVVARIDQASRHRKTHVAQTDKPNVH